MRFRDFNSLALAAGLLAQIVCGGRKARRDVALWLRGSEVAEQRASQRLMGRQLPLFQSVKSVPGESWDEQLEVKRGLIGKIDSIDSSCSIVYQDPAQDDERDVQFKLFPFSLKRSLFLSTPFM